MAKNKDRHECKYRFCGNGEGIPGLPHEISEQEAIQRGVIPQLELAIKSGVYIQIRSKTESEPVVPLEPVEGE